ncbi:hypothetical protein TNCV_3547161 [Trichonephila clavipes]|nr:hypothetical protein TNCV_3547161 [Trichonephila clavipes]
MFVDSQINQFKHSPRRDYLFFSLTPHHPCGRPLTFGIPFPPVQNNSTPLLPKQGTFLCLDRTFRGQKTFSANTATPPPSSVWKRRQHLKNLLPSSSQTKFIRNISVLNEFRKGFYAIIHFTDK